MKNLRFLLFLIPLLLIPSHSHAQKSALLWATYFGGDSSIFGGSSAVDDSGNVYLAGWTYSTKGVATNGAYQTLGDSISGDDYLAKFNSNGTLLWATYYGGESRDVVSALGIDKSGNVYMTGNTSSKSSIATKGAYQTSYSGKAYCGFVAKFSPTGSLLWGTYYGGANETGGDALAIDSSGNIYISGLTNCTSGISTPGATRVLLEEVKMMRL